MVKIRYAELPAGLHVAARTRGGDTVVYLLPGLTASQRRAALTRVRSSGRMGHGPRLSAASIAVAVGTDRIRTTASNGGAAVRRHPLLLLPSLVIMSGTIFALVSLIALAARPVPAVYPVRSAASVSMGQIGKSGISGSQRLNYLRLGEYRAGQATSPSPSHRTASGVAGIVAGHRHAFPHPAWSARGLRGMSPTSRGQPASQCVVLGLFGVCWTG